MKGSSLLVFVFLLFLALSLIGKATPNFYSVSLNHASPRIYHEKTSRFRLHSSDSTFSLMSTTTQRILHRSQSNDGATIKIETGAFNLRLPDRNFARFTQNTRFLCTKSKIIKRLAARFIKNKRKNILKRVAHFVYSYITDKKTGIPLLPAKDIAESRSGDCTEHSILAIALFRAIGIPARAVVGMVLVPEYRGRANRFVYHMWVEAYTAGEWYPVDATLPGPVHANRYVAFTYHHLKTEAPLAFLQAVESIRNLRVEYLPGR